MNPDDYRFENLITSWRSTDASWEFVLVTAGVCVVFGMLCGLALWLWLEPGE